MRRPSLCNLTMQKPSALSLGIRMFIIANTLFKDNMFVCVRPLFNLFFQQCWRFLGNSKFKFHTDSEIHSISIIRCLVRLEFPCDSGGNVQFIRELPQSLKSSEKWTGGCTSGSRADGQVLLQLSGTKGCKSYRS